MIDRDNLPADLEALCTTFGATLHFAELGVERGGLQGMLIPLDGDRFRVVVDPAVATADLSPPMPADATDRVAFVVAHELAHIQSYRRRPGARPVRAVHGGADETRCDAAALAFIQTRHRQPRQEP